MSTHASAKTIEINYVKTIGIVNNGQNGRGFSTPSDLAVADDGRIFVLNRCDPGRAAGIRVGICNLDEDYLGEFGYGYGAGDGQLIWPVCIAFDSKQRLFVTDEYNNRVSIYDSSGKFLGKWGEAGAGEGQVNGPAGIAFDSQNNVFIADQHNNRVQKFTPDGALLLGWGGRVTEKANSTSLGELPSTETTTFTWLTGETTGSRSSITPASSLPATAVQGPVKESSTDRPLWPWTERATFTWPTGATSGCRYLAPTANSKSFCGERGRFPSGRRSTLRSTPRRRGKGIRQTSSPSCRSI